VLDILGRMTLFSS
jgi:hypothetical protein